jgi:Family of unknown function (DUF5677)
VKITEAGRRALAQSTKTMGGRKPAEYRELRQQYKPESISLVIIAESPPSNGKYFYDRKGLPSEPLFAAMMKQLGVDPRCPKEDGLREFQRKGWFLVDATYKPVDKLSDSSADRVIKRRYQSLRHELATLIPDRSTPLVLIKVNVCHILEPRLTEDGFNVLNGGRAVYFPSNGRQPDFHRQFGAILESAGITQTAIGQRMGMGQSDEMTFQQRKADWLGHGQHLVDVALEIVDQCDSLNTTKGSRDPKVIALALLSRSLCHFKATCRLLEIGLIVEARTLTRCIFENLFVQGSLAERGDEFVQQMVDDAAKSRQSRGSWVLGWLDEQEGESPYEERLRETMDKLRELYPKPRAINFAEITKGSRLENAYLWYKQLSSDAAHPSLEALTRHITKKADGSIFVSIEPAASEKDYLDTIEWACQALLGVIVGANQIAGPVKAGEKLPALFDEFIRLAGAA